MDIVSTKMINTTETYITKNCHGKKVVSLYFDYSFISNHITIDQVLLITYYYLLSLSKT